MAEAAEGMNNVCKLQHRRQAMQDALQTWCAACNDIDMAERAVTRCTQAEGQAGLQPHDIHSVVGWKNTTKPAGRSRA